MIATTITAILVVPFSRGSQNGNKVRNERTEINKSMRLKIHPSKTQCYVFAPYSRHSDCIPEKSAPGRLLIHTKVNGSRGKRVLLLSRL